MYVCIYDLISLSLIALLRRNAQLDSTLLGGEEEGFGLSRLDQAEEKRYVNVCNVMYVCVYVCVLIILKTKITNNQLTLTDCKENISECMHVCMYVCMYVCMGVCRFVCMYVC